MAKNHTKATHDAAGELAGVQREARIMSALQIWIDYQSPRKPYLCRPLANDYLLRPPIHSGEVNGEMRETTNLNPYAIRAAFETVEDPTAALRFLSEAGSFWPFEAVLWSQFQEWQRFFSWLRRSPEEVMRSPEGAKAWRTADGFKNEFFSDAPPRFSPEAVEEIGPERMREIEVQDRHLLNELRRFAIRPERLHGECISIQWREAGDPTFKQQWPAKKHKGKNQTPFLNIEAHNIVEAIAATIYADRCHGLVYQACKRCGKLFKVDSQHGREFCPPTRLDIRTSPCKNAYLAQVRRDRLREEKTALQVKRNLRSSAS